MSQKFDDLKQKLKNVDKAQIGDLMKDFERAKEDGEINEKERQELMDAAKNAIGDSGFKGFGL
ncbi:hypothetical protein [Desemzia sp. RIT 804]|uniref:hypothetical protein n=1 Tax=Desemzia sp. RIT 804 TaxID=2810209 RepID=UPI001F1BA306|nr:hypothetical protein [Desemzia sp. RIT 804]